MKTKWTSVLIAVVIMLQGAVAAHGQEVAKTSSSISELREQIAKLANIESNEATPAEVKSLNHGFLEERRARLRSLLQNRVNALRSYRATVGSALSAEEARVVDGTIAEMERDLRELRPGATPPAAATADAATTGTAPTAARVAARLAPEPAEPLPGFKAPAATAAATSFHGSLLAPAPPQAAANNAGGDFVPRGSDPNEAPDQKNLFREAVKKEVAHFRSEVIRPPKMLPGQTLEQARREAFDFTANPLLFAFLLTNRMLPRDEFIKDIEAARIDKQTGASGGSATAGSTTLVSKGGTPAVLGFATEHGGLERSIDGTTVTFRGNPVGLVEAFQKEGFIASYKDDPSTRLLRKLSFSVSFDTSRGDTPGTLLANRQQLSSYSFRYEFKHDRDRRNEKYKKDWEELAHGFAQEVANILAKNQRALTSETAYVAWLDAAQTAIVKATKDNVSDEEMGRVVEQQLQAFQSIEVPPALAHFIDSFQTNFAAYRQDRSKLLDLVAKAPIFTLEYVNDRRPGMIDTSTLNFIAETGLFSGKADLTYNGSFTFFNANPGAGMKRVRNFDNSLRLDMPLGDMRRFGAFLTFAGKYKRMLEDDMTSGGATLPVKGDIATGQVLLTIPVGRTGFKIPISFSFANRTEFIKEKEVKGNFGFTFDLDSILGQLKPF